MSATSSTIVNLPDQKTARLPKRSYLNNEDGLLSWLLTGDHKRIAIMYLISITFFFFIGGAFAGLIRLELLTPQPDLVASDTYNKFFSMHGIIMVFLFLVPSVPATLGNFLIPIMIGAKDLAFRVCIQLFLVNIRSPASVSFDCWRLISPNDGHNTTPGSGGGQ
jgi:cytochrome c oxidase subunit I